MTRRSDSIRTRHLGGIVHGTVRQRAGEVVGRAAIQAEVPAPPPVLTVEEADAEGLIGTAEMADRLGVSLGKFNSMRSLGTAPEPAAVVLLPGWGRKRENRYRP